MNDLIKEQKLFANPEKLAKRHEDAQENVTGYLTSQLKGPRQFQRISWLDFIWQYLIDFVNNLFKIIIYLTFIFNDYVLVHARLLSV